MSTAAALLRTIRDAPDDDTARLVYADLVEEEGDPDRGEFIRVQIALSRLPDTEPRRRDLEDREHELLAANEARWLGVPPDADGLTEWEFERGFVEEVAATPWFMLGPGTDLCAEHPVRRWRVQAAQDNMPEDLSDCGRRGWFARLEALDLAGWYQTVGELERFLTRSDFARLRELDLTNANAARPGLDDLPGILERAPFRDQLRVLRCGGRYPGEAGTLDVTELVRVLSRARLTELALPGCVLTADDLRTLLAADCCRELTSLDVRENELEPDGWDAFRSARCRLRELDLSGTPLGGISLDDVLRSDSLSELRSLHVNRCGSAMANIRALAGSRFWAQAEELRMHGGTIPERALDPLFAAAGPPGLRILDVAGNFFRDAGVERLCSAAWAGSLQWLDLSRNYLTDESLRLIAASGRFANLRTLHLRGNNPFELDGAETTEILTHAGIRTLAESPRLPNLRTLNLSGSLLNREAVESLLDGPLTLTGLGFSGSAERVVVQGLARSPRLARLTWLDLSYSGGTFLDPANLSLLAESEYLSPLCELDIRGCPADDETRAALRARLGRRLSE